MAVTYGTYTTDLTGIPDNVDLTTLKQLTLRVPPGQPAASIADVLDYARQSARVWGTWSWPGMARIARVMQYLAAPSPEDSVFWRSGEALATRVDEDFMPGQVSRMRRSRSGAQAPEYQAIVPMPAYHWANFRGRSPLLADEMVSDVNIIFGALGNEVAYEAARCGLTKAARTVVGSSTGKAPGWLGGTSQNFTAPKLDGKTAATSHYFNSASAYADSSAGVTALHDAMYAVMKNECSYTHTMEQPLLFLHHSDDLATVQGMAAYAAPQIIGVTPGPGSTTSVITDIPTVTVPGVGTQFLAHGKLTNSGAWCVDMGDYWKATYYGLIKSKGIQSPDNPIRLCFPEDYGFGPVLVDLRYGFPIDTMTVLDVGLVQNLAAWIQYGWMVRDPLAGAAGLVGNHSSWADPTITTA